MEVGVPAGGAFLDVSLVVRYWINADVLEHDHGSAALDNAEEDVARFGSLKCDVKPEPVAIKRQRTGNIPDNEERGNAGNFWLSHLSFHRAATQEFLAVGGYSSVAIVGISQFIAVRFSANLGTGQCVLTLAIALISRQ